MNIEIDSQKSKSLDVLINNKELILALLSGVCWGIAGLLYLSNDGTNSLSSFLFIPAIILGGYFPFLESAKSLLNKELNIDVLMIFAAVGAVFLGNLGDAALLLFLFSLGHALEIFALNKVKKRFSSLNKLHSKSAMVIRNGEIIELSIEEIVVGDIVNVKPNSKIPVDAVIRKGESHVDQSTITGESMPVHKKAIARNLKIKSFESLDSKHQLFAGTINGEGVLEVMVMRIAEDTTLSRLIRLVKDAEAQKSPTQHLADTFEKYYVPAVLLLVATLMFSFLILDETFQVSFYRAMATLIAASPCALAISTPSAVLAGIARAAKEGVLIKGGMALENLASIDVMAFDKTGTLTHGEPKLVEIISYGQVSNDELLDLTSSVEILSDHPIAKAIVAEVKDVSLLPQAKNIKSLTARGVKATIDNEDIFIGNRRLIEEISEQSIPESINTDLIELEIKGNTILIVYYKNAIIGLLGVMDTAREEVIETISKLEDLGLKKMIMISGDNQGVADAIAKKVGIKESYGNLLPSDKVDIIDRLVKDDYKVAMVGDGVNDAPALSKATLGIAMGAAGSDVALETADIALMSDKLENLPFAIRLSRKAKRVITQNIIISMGVVAVLVPLTILGIAEIGPAVIGHEGSTIVVVLNALRLLKFNK